MDLLDNEDAMLVLDHALHHIFSLQDFEKFFDQSLLILIQQKTYLICSFNTFFENLLRKVLDG